MPRDSTGVVTLVVGNPVVDDTAITADWANRTIADLAAMIEDSLSRSGEGGMLVPMLFADGTGVGAPGIGFANDTDTGIRLVGAGDMRLVAAATDILKILSSGVTITGTLGVSGATTLNSALTIAGTISGVTDPSTAQQAATKNYVDTQSPVKAWAQLLCGGAGSVTVNAGLNVASATYAANTMTVNFTSALADNKYAAVANLYGTSGSAPTDGFALATGLGAALVQINLFTTSTGAARNWVLNDSVNLIVCR